MEEINKRSFYVKQALAEPGFSSLEPGAHIAFLYSSPQEQKKMLLAFLEAALSKDKNSLCLLCCGEKSTEITEQIAAKAAEFKNRIIFWEHREAAEAALDKFFSFLQETLSLEKDRCIWIAVDTKLLLIQKNHEAMEEKIARYELSLENILSSYAGTTILCMYDLQAFPPKDLKKIVISHPFLLWQNKVYPNPHALPFENCFYPLPEWDQDYQELLAYIKSITERKSLETILQEEINLYQRLYELAESLLYDCAEETAFQVFLQKAQEIFHLDAVLMVLAPEKEGAAARIISSRGRIEDAENPETVLEKEGLKYWTKIEITQKGRHFGFLYCASKNPFVFSRKEENLAAILNKLASLKIIRCEAEKALQDSEKQLASIINHLPDAVMILDKDQKVISWNLAMERLTGVKASKMLNRGNYEYSVPIYGKQRSSSIDLLFNPEEKVEEKDSLVFEDPATISAEISTTTPQGQEKVLWTRAVPFYDANGNFRGAIQSIRDITPYKAIQKSYEATKSVLEATVNALGTLAEKRDPYTAGHQKRVAKIACAIARQMRLPEKEKESIFYASLFLSLSVTPHFSRISKRKMA